MCVKDIYASVAAATVWFPNKEQDRFHSKPGLLLSLVTSKPSAFIKEVSER